MYVHTQMCSTYTHTQYYHLQHEPLFISLLIIYFWKKVSISLLIINMVTHASIFVSIFSQFLQGSRLGRGGLTVECECDVLEALPASFYTDCMQLPGEIAAVTQPALLLWVVNLAHVSPCFPLASSYGELSIPSWAPCHKPLFPFIISDYWSNISSYWEPDDTSMPWILVMSACVCVATRSQPDSHWWIPQWPWKLYLVSCSSLLEYLWLDSFWQVVTINNSNNQANKNP